MPRGKAAQKATNEPNKQTNEKATEKNQNENTVNGEELTMSQLTDMIKKHAAEIFEEKKKELKEEMKEEMEEEMEYRLITQFGELEEMIDEAKEEVQKSVNKVKTQIDKLSKNVQQIQSQSAPSGNNETFKQQLQSAIEGLDNVKAESRKLKKRLEKVEFDTCSRIPKNIQVLTNKFDEFEQQQNENNVQIVGLPDSESGEEDKDKIVKIARDTFGMDLKISDIEKTYRMGKKREDAVKARDTIVKFKEKTTRDKFYENRKQLVINENPNENIYVNDHLTSHRQHLLYVARKLYKAKKIKAAWSQGGNILIRKIENGPVIPVHCHDDLSEIQQPDEDGGEFSADGSDNDLASDMD